MGAGSSRRGKAQTGPEIVVSKRDRKIQREEYYNTSMENMGSNVQQTKREFQEKRIKMKRDRKGNIKFIEMYEKYVKE